MDQQQTKQWENRHQWSSTSYGDLRTTFRFDKWSKNDFVDRAIKEDFLLQISQRIRQLNIEKKLIVIDAEETFLTIPVLFGFDQSSGKRCSSFNAFLLELFDRTTRFSLLILSGLEICWESIWHNPKLRWSSVPVKRKYWSQKFVEETTNQSFRSIFINHCSMKQNNKSLLI